VGPDGEGVTSAFVDVYPSGGAAQASVTSDGRYGEAGSFEVAGLEPGPAIVCVQYLDDDEAYESACYDGQPYDLDDPAGTVVDLPSREVLELVIELPRNHPVTRPGGLTGSVSAAGTDDESGVEVGAFDEDGVLVATDVTDGAGEWLMEDLAAGHYSVCFDGSAALLTSECFDDQPYDSSGADSDPVTVNPGQFTRVDADLSLRLVDITGRVTSATGMPIGQVAVVLQGGPGQQPIDIVETGSDGAYSLPDVIAGRRYAVCFEASGTGFVSECHQDQPFPSRAETASLERELINEDTVRDAVLSSSTVRRASVRGSVTDEQGDPVDGYVYVLDELTGLADSEVARTARDGSFVVGDIPDGRVQICVDTSLYDLPTGQFGYAPECWGDVPNFVAGHGAGTVLTAAGQITRGVDFGLGLGSALTIRAVDPEGRPVSTYYAMGWDRVLGGIVTDTQETNGYLSDGGVRRFSDLPSGDYYVCVGDGRWFMATSEFEDRCYAGAAAPPPYTWAGSGAGTGTAAAAAAGATIVHLVPGAEQTITITLPRRPAMP
jgi:hypothetical protein